MPGNFVLFCDMLLVQISICLLFIVSRAADDGFSRLSALRSRSFSNASRVIHFSPADFQEYVMKYPRPYDIVIFFSASGYQLCKELLPKFEYLAKLYERAGSIDAPKNPTFFALLEFSESRPIFKAFGFETVPNIVVSQPHMAIITDPRQRAEYYREFTWKITPSDNEVTTDKMLEYVNKKVGKNVVFQLPAKTIQTWTLYFVAAAVGLSIIYTQLKVIWNHWVFWFVSSVAIYLTCQSGIVYCILHDITWKTQGQGGIFAGGSREQSMQEGFFISGIIVTIAMMLILVGVLGRKCSQKFSSIVCVLALLLVYVGVSYLENVYKQKGWYGPSFRPPEHYLKGPLKIDQGNSI